MSGDKSKGGAQNDDVSDDIVDDKETKTGDDDASGDDETDTKVSRSAYKKAVTKEKAAKERARLAEERANKLEQEKLEAQGNKDEQIKALSAQLKESNKKTKDLYGNMARKTLSAQVKAVATAAGCIDADAVMKLSDLSELEVDPETFEADAQDVQAMIADLKKSKPYLFSKASPKINTKLPGGKGDKDDEKEKEDLSKLSPAELRLRLRALDKK